MSNQDIKLKEIRRNELLTKIINNDNVTEEMCLELVKIYGMDLDRIPEDMKTEKVCWEAVKQCGLVLFSVPKDIITEEMCLSAIKFSGFAIKYVPEHILTEEMCLISVRDNGCFLRFIEDRTDLITFPYKIFDNFKHKYLKIVATQLPENDFWTFSVEGFENHLTKEELVEKLKNDKITGINNLKNIQDILVILEQF